MNSVFNTIPKEVFIAFDDKKAVGYGIYQLLWGNTPFLSLLKVIPDYQRHGIGPKILEKIEDRLKKQGYK